MRILVAEDDALLGDALQSGLRQRGFEADCVRDGVAADLALAGEAYAAVVLDLGLPRRDGMTVLAAQRAKGNTVPVLVLTARDAVDDRIKGLDTGADDYVVKPVDLDELAARLRALVRRSHGEPSGVIEIGALAIDPAARTVRFRGVHVALKPREFNLLHEFALSAGRVLTREQIEQRLYSWGEEVESNAVDVHIHHLRRKLAPEVIRTVRGVGYLLAKDAGDG
jgi:two-component system OmpR family response regulator/two-component system response regulator QseB